MADYMVVFRKWDNSNTSEFPDPVKGSDSERFSFYVGMEPPFGHKQNPHSLGTKEYREWSIMAWQKYASPVWFDIDQTNVLNYQLAREDKDEKHICPLQLDVIERSIHLWSNEGDLVLSPFAGIGSEGYGAVNLNRKFVGIELKRSYFDHACKNLAEVEKTDNDIFNYLEESE